MGCSTDTSEPEPSDPDVSEPSGPAWETIKANTLPTIELPSAFETPQRLAVGTLAWEDGIHVSDDGLSLFAFHAPMDVIKYSQYVAANPVCPPVLEYLRGAALPGTDLDLIPPIDNPWDCPDGVLHSDIAVATRTSTDEDFSSWQRHAVSGDFKYDGGFSAADNGDGTFHLVFSQSTHDGNLNDIYWVGNALSLHPASATPISISSTINDAGQQDNPHLERLDESQLILLFDNHGADDPDTEIRYSMSSDDGSSWSTPQLLDSINSPSSQEMHGHLFEDNQKHWWMYFASDRDNGILGIYRSPHASDDLAGDFDHWGPVEKVISVGSVTGNHGFVAGLGEPTLTADGDLYFAVVYRKHPAHQTETDAYDSDPWFAPGTPPEAEPVPAPQLGTTGKPDGVQVVLITKAPWVDGPTDLAFDPAEPKELWVVNRGSEAFTVIQSPGSNPYITKHPDMSHHFLEQVVSLSFGDAGSFATCGDTRNEFHGAQSPDDFMGPALWPADEGDFDTYACSGVFSDDCPDAANVHLDMLHATPYCMGIVAAGGTTFYAFNGKDGSIELYDFNEPHGDVPHGHGGDDHSDGEKFQIVAPGMVSRKAGVPSHMVYVSAEKMLYIADTGNSRLLKVDTNGLDPGTPIWKNYDDGTSFHKMNGAAVEDFISEDSGLLAEPSGLAIYGEWIYVGDFKTGHILAFDMAGNLVNELDTGRGPGSLGGITFDEDGSLYFADTLRSEIIRIGPKP
jgi:hypothetical protein